MTSFLIKNNLMFIAKINLKRKSQSAFIIKNRFYSNEKKQKIVFSHQNHIKYVSIYIDSLNVYTDNILLCLTKTQFDSYTEY